MVLFQASVLKKYIELQDSSAVDKAYVIYSKYFHDPVIQENIRLSKEEQFQEGFLRELFVRVFGYSLNPSPGFNLTMELKNEKGAKKADGAILNELGAIAVIELKSTKTKNLESIRQQAFDYKANQSECIYVITSNFEKIRFYVENAVDFEEFNLFNLNLEEFKLLYLCLNCQSLLNNIPLRVKNESLVEEEKITSKLYEDYSLFKRELFRDLVKRNMKNSIFREELAANDRAGTNIKLSLFKKSQKLIDRFLFIFFAEDRSLLPPNSTLTILDEWDKLKELDVQIPLYDRFKKYFEYLDQGRKGTESKREIFAYNGGLFKDDMILNCLEIDDELLYEHTKKLTKYDFQSQIDVNILGHIFENSLNEIENVNAEIAGFEFNERKTKRKKDGVFYTPKYITKYIVDITVGDLCSKKKIEFGIFEEEYLKSKKGRKRNTLSNLKSNLDKYRYWLLTLSICDPSCGSGAFLNQTLDFLINEHRYIDELEASLFGGGLIFQDIENTILESNIYGVDVNQESVEIAKLSLWLRTAQPRRKLSNLSNNIKCGNSLIENNSIAVNKAFNWEEEFPEVFEAGGFDVILGNPPYLRVQGLRESFEKESNYYEKQYRSATGRFDIYVLFIEKSLDLIKEGGLVSFILPHKFLTSDFGKGIRQFLSERRSLNSILHFGSEMVFSDASAYTCIIKLTDGNDVLSYSLIKPEKIFDPIKYDQIDYKSLSSDKWNLTGGDSSSIFDKLNSQPLRVKDVFSAVRTGVDTGTDDIFVMRGRFKGDLFCGYSERLEKDIFIESSIVKPMLKGKDVKRYSPITNDHFVIYPHKEVDGKTKPYEEGAFKIEFPKTYAYLVKFKEELTNKKIHKKTNPEYWFSLHRARDQSIFEQQKIITPETSLGGNLTIDVDNHYHNTQAYSLIKSKAFTSDYKYWLAILNSSTFWYFLKQTGAVLRGGYFRFKTKHLEPFPLPPECPADHMSVIIGNVDKYLLLKSEFINKTQRFLKYLNHQFNLDKPSRKLQSWESLDFSEFISEINRLLKIQGAVKLSKVDEFDWMDLFESNKSEALLLINRYTEIDSELNQLVYALYGFDKKEIQIIESD